GDAGPLVGADGLGRERTLRASPEARLLGLEHGADEEAPRLADGALAASDRVGSSTRRGGAERGSEEGEGEQVRTLVAHGRRSFHARRPYWVVPSRPGRPRHGRPDYRSRSGATHR